MHSIAALYYTVSNTFASIQTLSRRKSSYLIGGGSLGPDAVRLKSLLLLLLLGRFGGPAAAAAAAAREEARDGNVGVRPPVARQTEQEMPRRQARPPHVLVVVVARLG